jgi:hypothetical protein
MANDKDFKIKNGLQVGGAFVEKVGTVTGNADVDLSTGNVFDYTPTANATFTFSNAGATEHSFVLKVDGVLIDNAYDLANAVAPVQPGKFYVGGQTGGNNEDVFFKPDGTKMYVVGLSNDSVHEYSLTTAWEISTSVYVQSFNVGSQETLPTAVFFKTDGTKMYVSGYSGDDVNEYNLSTAWDISTATYVQSFSVAAQETDSNSLFFKPDGTKMYVLGYGSNAVNEYSLSTAWDVSTASYVQNFSVSGQDTVPFGLFFKDDGTKIYVTGAAGDDVNEYSLSSAWDVSTASYVQNFSVSAQVTVATGLFFKSDGTKMYAIGRNERTVFAYTLTTAWDISTASFDLPTEGYFSVAAQETNPTGLFFKPDGSKMYVTGSADNVSEYDISLAWDISTASFVQNFSVSAQETQPQGLFFKPDGTKMYLVGYSGGDVNEYDLSTAWDISTASYVQNFSVSTQDAAMNGVFFKSDGSKFYLSGTASDSIYSYSLTSPWDISTASYVHNFSVYSQDSQPSDLFFKPDGTKMYVSGTVNDSVNEYSLTTAWDISTASYVQSFSVAAQETAPNALFLGDNGTKMYVIGQDSSSVWQYTTGTYGDATLTYPASVKFPSGTAPAAPADGETDILEFSTTDGGTTWYGVRTGDAMA